MKRYVLAALLMLRATPALADKAYQACTDATVTDPGFTACGVAYLKRADAELNAAWTRAFAKVSGQSKSDLPAEQRAWIAYRDASCRYYMSGDWGREGQVLDFFGCRGAVIETRTAELKELAAPAP